MSVNAKLRATKSGYAAAKHPFRSSYPFSDIGFRQLDDIVPSEGNWRWMISARGRGCSSGSLVARGHVLVVHTISLKPSPSAFPGNLSKHWAVILGLSTQYVQSPSGRCKNVRLGHLLCLPMYDEKRIGSAWSLSACVYGPYASLGEGSAWGGGELLR